MSVIFDFSHSLDTLIDLLTDADFLVERNLALGDLETDCEVEGDDELIVVRMTRKKPVELNAFFAKFFDPVQDLSMVETWRRDADGWTGDYEVQIKAQPLTMSASFSLKPHAGGSRYEITQRCKAKIPIVGGKIEKEALVRAGKGVLDELEFAREKLG